VRRQAYVEVRLEKVNAAGCAQVHFGVYGSAGQCNGLRFASLELHRTKMHADHPAAISCSGLVA
jgi:hypothetical protein